MQADTKNLVKIWIIFLLLSHLQLGDPENKVASNADYHLANLLAEHPNMKVIAYSISAYDLCYILNFLGHICFKKGHSFSMTSYKLIFFFVVIHIKIDFSRLF